MPDITASVDRLYAFRQQRSVGDLIDERSGLTADDLDAVLAAFSLGKDAPGDIPPPIDDTTTHDWGKG